MHFAISNFCGSRNAAWRTLTSSKSARNDWSVFLFFFKPLSLEDKENPTHGWSLGTATSPVQQTEGTSFHLPTRHREIHVTVCGSGKAISTGHYQLCQISRNWGHSLTVRWRIADFPHFWGEIIWNENLATLMLHRKLRLARFPRCDHWLIRYFNIQVKKVVFNRN